MKNWFVNNFVNAGVVIGAVTAFLYFIGVATQAGYDSQIGVSSGLFQSSFYDMLVYGVIFLAKGMFDLNHVASINFIIMITVFPVVIFLLRKFVFFRLVPDKSDLTTAFNFLQMGLNAAIYIIFSLALVAYVFNFFVDVGRDQAKNELEDFKQSQILFLTGRVRVEGVVLKCSITHCAFAQNKLTKTTVSVVPVSEIIRIDSVINDNLPTE